MARDPEDGPSGNYRKMYSCKPCNDEWELYQKKDWKKSTCPNCGKLGKFIRSVKEGKD